jgi:hypothetical protein
MTTGERRLVQVRVSDAVMAWFFAPSPGGVECVHGIPGDAVLVHLGRDPLTGEVTLLFAHPTFDPVPAGDRVPERQVRFARRDAPLPRPAYPRGVAV